MLRLVLRRPYTTLRRLAFEILSSEHRGSSGVRRKQRFSLQTHPGIYSSFTIGNAINRPYNILQNEFFSTVLVSFFSFHIYRECFMPLRSARDYRHRRFAARVLDARGCYFGNVSRGNAELACLFFIVNAKGDTHCQ